MFATEVPQAQVGAPAQAGDIAWILTATGLVLLMTPGLSFFYGGMVGTRNVISTMLQSFVALGVVSLVWLAVGFSLAFGDSIGGLIGNPFTFMMFRGVGVDTHPSLSPTVPLLLFAMFQLKFAVITPALVTGSFAERVRFSAYLLFMCLFTIFVYAPLAHWTWHPQGFLRVWGVLDFAGGTVVHMSAGFAALAGAMYLGPRMTHARAAAHPPSNTTYVLLGTGMLWFGWFGFNAGSALAANEVAVHAFATTNTASAAAMLAWMFFDGLRGRRPSALGACIGAVVGLVAITPAAAYVSLAHSIVIGVAASLLSNVAAHLKSRSTLDDTLDVFPCHGVGGIAGMILTGALARGVGLIAGQTATFLRHLLALVIVGVFSFAMSMLIFRVTNFFVSVRVRPEDEAIGLDISQHAEWLGLVTAPAGSSTGPGAAGSGTGPRAASASGVAGASGTGPQRSSEDAA
ncbi:MAG TPA: ammonium transporter [Candidatus Polarisedimenticolia bacterium]|nr:ammonium transporter [Candidatus Polarisedimenticolia bacterium]